MAHQSPIRTPLLAPASGIPDKLYFRIGELARLCDVPAYVLRFWESEFPHLKPNKGGSGQRLYRRRDVEMALRIKRLLYDEGYTIPGARQILKGEQRLQEPQLPLLPSDASHPRPLPTLLLQQLRRDLRELLSMVSRPPSAPAPRSLRRQPPPIAADRQPEILLDFARPPDETQARTDQHTPAQHTAAQRTGDRPPDQH